MTERFYDISGADASGNIVITISDLLSLLGSGLSGTNTAPPVTTDYSLLNEIRSDVKSAVHDELMNAQWSSTGSGSGSAYESQTLIDDSCIDSFATQQGSDYMRYVPGKNPDDYIRKDSVPCYGCSIP